MTLYGGRYQTDGTAANAGGMGSVEICTDGHLDRKVAIKFLLPGTEKRRIMDEIRALQRIRSKHVVQLYDVVVLAPGNQIGIVQECLPGPDLTALWRSAAKRQQLLRVLYQLARGLEDIHAQGIIHRDIKPNNVRYDSENILKIFDFGLARTDDDREARTRGPVGTRPFMAPELYACGSVRFTQAIDVYAFAVTAIMLTKPKCPAELAETPPLACDWVRARGFATLHMPRPIASVLDRALAAKPEDRPSMREVREAVQAHLVFDQHRALLTTQAGHVLACHKGQRTAVARNGAVGKISIHYDGAVFTVAAVEGSVYVNNVRLQVGTQLPECCVLTINGESERDRLFVTLDISKPEVVL